MSFTQEQIMTVKGQGFLPLKDKIHFAARIVIPAGRMEVAYSQKINEIAEKYGRGYFTLTQRLDVEIPWIKYEDIQAVKAELATVNLTTGGTGLRIRPIHTCKGNVCRVGLYDTEQAALDMHERFYKAYYTTKFPNKLRLGLSGCFNNCSKPQLACIGMVGKKRDQVAVFIGGTFGRQKNIGQELTGLYSVSDALDIMERGIKFYLENGEPGERFAAMVERLGFDTVQEAMLGPLI
ncbi:MAG: hypothetical protein ACRCTE_07300 [Cellulosilyticaceae bacterium]